MWERDDGELVSIKKSVAHRCGCEADKQQWHSGRGGKLATQYTANAFPGKMQFLDRNTKKRDWRDVRILVEAVDAVRINGLIPGRAPHHSYKRRKD